MFAEGAPSETLLLGDQAVSALESEAMDELNELFPDLAQRDFRATCPALPVPTPKIQRKIIKHLNIIDQKPLTDRNAMTAPYIAS